MLDRGVRAKVEEGLRPVARGLRRIGLTANGLTLLGLAFAVVTAVLVAQGRFGWAAVALVATSVPDVLDGAVAKSSGTAGPRGAFFDSVVDRVTDALVLGGAAWYYAGTDPRLAMLPFAVLAATLVVSYERAKAESLGFDARGGLMERAERLVTLIVALAFDVLEPVLWVMLALTVLTAVQRFVKVWRQASPHAAGRERARSRFLERPRVRRLAERWPVLREAGNGGPAGRWRRVGARRGTRSP